MAEEAAERKLTQHDKIRRACSTIRENYADLYALPRDEFLRLLVREVNYLRAIGRLKDYGPHTDPHFR